MNILNLILALICFGGGFLIADSSLETWQSVLLLVVLAGVVLLIRQLSNKKDK